MLVRTSVRPSEEEEEMGLVLIKWYSFQALKVHQMSLQFIPVAIRVEVEKAMATD